MRTTLTTTWNPRGEDKRLIDLLPLLHQVYTNIIIVIRPEGKVKIQEQLKSENVILVNSPEWAWGRYLALKAALDTDAEVIHYADMDRLLRWVETRPQEWKQAVLSIQEKDCVVFGRTDAAYHTHPQAMFRTEQISNMVASHFLGEQMDISAGSKAFSRKAVSFLVDYTLPRRAIGTDAEWLILLKRGGYSIDYKQVDGLDYESADRYQNQAANVEEQRQASAIVDDDPNQWACRVEIALEIVQSTLEAQQVIISEPAEHKTEQTPVYDSSTVDFKFDEVFEVDDYLYFYSDALTDERTDSEVASIIQLLQLDSPVDILDLACGFRRHTNRLAALGHHMTGVDRMVGFLEIARNDAKERGVSVNYIQEDMRSIIFKNEFDCVLVLFTAFGYFSDEENLHVLNNIYRALKPGGKMLIDTLNRDVFLKNMMSSIVTEKEGNLMIDRPAFDSLTGYQINRRIVIRDGIRKDKPFKIRLYNSNEIRDFLKQTGFESVQIYGGWDGQPVTPESRRLIITSRKPG